MLSETSIKRRDNMAKKLNIAAYCRISVDDEKNNENVSIENQKLIIKDHIERNFKGADYTFYEDRDKSGYTFEQRPGYQKMRPLLLNGTYDILIVKDLSRFSRRNSRGLAEIEDLVESGLRIIAIGDGVDYPKYEDWMKIQMHFFINEMPVTETSKKVKNVVKRRQQDGNWICAVPYGYVLTDTKNMKFSIDPSAAEIVRMVFELYNNGWGYKKIAHYLTEQQISTPKMCEIERKDAQEKKHNIKASTIWSTSTIQSMIQNDFYIGTLRQGKYTRKKINGADIRKDKEEHLVFENHHKPIVDYKTFAVAQEQLKKRTRDNYRGIKKYTNAYSGLLVCGDCGSPMFPMSRKENDAYRCGAYHKHGRKACTSHFVKISTLDNVVKLYLSNLKNTSAKMIENLQELISKEAEHIETDSNSIKKLEKELEEAIELRKVNIRMQSKMIMKYPDKESYYEEMYTEMISNSDREIDAIRYQIEMVHTRQNNIRKINRLAKNIFNIFDEILEKDNLDKQDLLFIIDKIYVYDDNIHVKLKNDIENILNSDNLDVIEDTVNFKCDIVNIESNQTVQMSNKHRDKVYGVNVICEGDPLEIYTDADGEVIFKKYSPMGELSEFTSQYAEVLHRATGMPVIITDRDHVISCSGLSKKDTMDRHISKELEEIMENRSSFVAGSDKGVLMPVEGLDRNAAIAYPIVGGGDVSGAVILLFNENGTAPTQSEIKLAQVAASFLGKQTEE